VRLAIVDENDKVYVEYDTEVFKKLLVKYAAEWGSVEKAFDLVVDDLKKLTLRR